MNSVLNRAALGSPRNCHEFSKPNSVVQKLPTSYYHSGKTAVPSSTQPANIKWRDSSVSHNLTDCNNKENKLKLSSSQLKYVNRSNSTDDKSSKPVHNRSSRIGRIESTESIIEMHKFFKEKRIYSDPNDNYKRRTIVLVKNPNGRQSSGGSHRVSSNELSGHGHHNNADFGFHLQSYGLVNTSTNLTEFICFVDNVQPGSPAKHSGMSNGDVLLAIDGIAVSEFKNLHDIMKHVRGKQELRLVIMCENVCKKIQLQQRVESIKSMISAKKAELDRANKQQDSLIAKATSSNSVVLTNNTCTSPLSSSTTSSMTGSSISESQLYPPSPMSDRNNNTAMLSPGLHHEYSNILIKNSTPLELKSSSVISPSVDEYLSLQSENRAEQKVPSYRIEPSMINDGFISRNKSISSPNGTARIQVDNNLDFTSPIIEASSSTYSTYSSSSTTSSSSADSSKAATSGFTFHRTRQLAQKCLQETSRIVRSASSSSMNIITNLKLNRSSRSRNSSMCSTMNDSIDLTDCNNKSRLNKLLNKSVVSDENPVICSKGISVKLQKNNSMCSENTTKSKLLFNSLSMKQQPQLHKPSVRSNSKSNHKKIFNKLNSSSNASSFDTSILESSSTYKNSSTSSNTSNMSKFTILQNKPKTERFTKPMQRFSSINTSETNGKLNTSFLSQAFSPILSSDQPSLLNEIIDSGIDVGIALPVSPNNSTTSSNYCESGVAKVISDGGYTFMNELAHGVLINEAKHSSFRNVGGTKQIYSTVVENSSDDCLVTKL